MIGKALLIGDRVNAVSRFLKEHILGSRVDIRGGNYEAIY